MSWAHVKTGPCRRRPAPERFWEKVDKNGPNGCWLWLGGQYKNGYGEFHPMRLKTVPAHRFAYELAVGHIPAGLEIDHLCRNRLCVNPCHLEAVSGRENILRGTSVSAQNARKTRCPQGHPYDLLNTCYSRTGSRKCRICRDERLRAYMETRRSTNQATPNIASLGEARS